MKYGTIARESLKPVLDELTREIRAILEEPKTKDEREAFKLLLGTLFRLVSDIFGYLPPEEQSYILVTCGTWLDIGLLIGKSPGKLGDILEKANPEVEDIELPDWMWSIVGGD